MAYGDAVGWMLDHVGARVCVRIAVGPWPLGGLAEWRGVVEPPREGEPGVFRIGEDGWLDIAVIFASTEVEDGLLTLALAEGVELHVAEV